MTLPLKTVMSEPLSPATSKWVPAAVPSVSHKPPLPKNQSSLPTTVRSRGPRTFSSWVPAEVPLVSHRPTLPAASRPAKYTLVPNTVRSAGSSPMVVFAPVTLVIWLTLPPSLIAQSSYWLSALRPLKRTSLPDMKAPIRPVPV